jgi:photosystem II stability/assembly factor-like uncharacterized protein
MHKLLSSSAQRAVFAVLSMYLCLSAMAQPVDPSLTSGLRWRMIGPFRGGRSIAVSGIEGQPNIYYFGSVGGGVWKTVNGGETWEPVFDGQPIGSIGALAVAPSNPNVIYVGTGEADLRSDLSYGNGMYKSTDAGKTWTHIGLGDSRHIARITVDPRNPDVVLVAALGEAYGPNPERGVFRSTDGGATWQKVLYKDANIGAIDLAADPDDPQTFYAALLHDQRPPWSTYPPFTTSGAIYRSADGGVTWQQISGGGLPSSGDWGRVGLAVARGTHGQRVYALIDARDGGLFRSDDAGKTWTLVATDSRIRGRLWYFSEVIVDPKDPDTVYLPNVSIYRSNDGGKTFTGIKGAPGGDDYHSLWIDPSNPQRMIFGSDQGVGVSMDGGKSWSSWYNQPTAQIYHVAVDNQFPYHVYGAQQDSGTIDTSSRGNDGSITFRDWHPAGAGESGYIVPDPADPTIIYGGGTYGELVRYDKRTGQSQNIAPEAVRSFGADPTKAPYRFTWTSPIVFSPQDPHVLYFGSQYLLKTTDRGNNWQKISPDLTGTDPNASHDGPTTVDNAKQRGHGVIYTIAPSPVKAGQIWVGTDTGLVHLTRDSGKTWTDVTPTGLAPWSKISLIDASRFDAATAYVAVDRHRLADIGPYIYRTHDAGKTWTRINAGIPDGAYVRAVREDGIRQGLLFAGTELGVYFSIDDGDHWQPLQLNLPVTPVHDLVVKRYDLIIATHGRSFWILDDITPLREITSENPAPVLLFQPATAMRIRPSTNHDTPLPGEVPAGENPPPGAVFYYYLQSPVQSEVKIEILDSRGQVARAYSSAGQPWSPPTNLPIPAYWFKPPVQPSTAAGMHRFVWDLRYSVPPAPNAGYGMSTAIALGVPLEPEGPLAFPGAYQVQLTVNGKSYRQPFNLTMDPRVAAGAQDLERQFTLATRLTQGLERALQLSLEIHDARAAGRISEEIERKLAGGSGGGRGAGGGAAPDIQASGGPQLVPLAQLAGTLGQLIGVVESADAAPTTQAVRSAEETLAQLQATITEWEKAKR